MFPHCYYLLSWTTAILVGPRFADQSSPPPFHIIYSQDNRHFGRTLGSTIFTSIYSTICPPQTFQDNRHAGPWSKPFSSCSPSTAHLLSWTTATSVGPKLESHPISLSWGHPPRGSKAILIPLDLFCLFLSFPLVPWLIQSDHCAVMDDAK